MLFIICLVVFAIMFIKAATEKELPEDYHNNWRKEMEDANKVRRGEMSKKDFIKNMENGKYK